MCISKLPTRARTGLYSLSTTIPGLYVHIMSLLTTQFALFARPRCTLHIYSPVTAELQMQFASGELWSVLNCPDNRQTTSAWVPPGGELL